MCTHAVDVPKKKNYRQFQLIETGLMAEIKNQCLRQ